MTMPKKGLRKIVVDGKIYNYVIKKLLYGGSDDKRLTIELPSGKYYSEVMRDTVDSITPSMVKKIIKENLLGQRNLKSEG